MMDLLGLLAWGPEGWGDELAEGLWVTVQLSLATLPFGVVLGLLVAIARDSGEPSLVLAGDIFTTIFRGLPELLTLFLVYYGLQMLYQRVAEQVGAGPVELSGFIAGFLALGVVFAAFASEAFLSAFRAISAGQYEAGYALGLSPWKVFRLIILPQLIRLSLPALGNLWLVLIKTTSLVSVIAYDDLLRKTNIAVGFTKEPLFFYSVACLLYLALAILTSGVFSTLETRLKRGERA